MRVTAFLLLFFLMMVSSAFSKTPPEVLKPYKDYRTALASGDKKLAGKHALKAWEASESALGDHKTTGDLAYNYAKIAPKGKLKDRYKNYKLRVKAFKRAIELSTHYGNDAVLVEVERRIDHADLEIKVARSYDGKRRQYRKLDAIKDLDEFIVGNGLSGTTFEGDLNVLYARFYELDGEYEKAISSSEKAIDIYNKRTDKHISQYEYFVRLFKGNSHKKLEEEIEAALEYQVVMQNLEGQLPADHVFVETAFQKWMTTRWEIEEAGLLEEAEAKGLCECWPYENYKTKAIPLKRVPPIMPRYAERSGHVFVKYDVSEVGKPENVSVVSSSQSLFEKAALESVEKWSFTKLTAEMKAEPEFNPDDRKNLTTKITFILSTEIGKIIPE